ncbi:MAG: hypothetical protein H7301_02695 [Cryobacterium sp.]|nr:hypothetical protein [Oligoflexia bacterium]
MNMRSGNLFVVAMLLSFSGCLKSNTAATSASSGGTFTASDLVKSWVGNCQLTAAEPITGATYSRVTLTLSAGSNFDFYQDWYAGTPCGGGNAKIVYRVAGTYTVGGLISGSSSVQDIQFTATSSRLGDYEPVSAGAGVQTQVNTACGGTSPYNVGGASTSNNGITYSSFMMSCSSITLPNSSNRTINNVATLSGGVLTIGTNYAGIPGVFAGNATPTSASIALY